MNDQASTGSIMLLIAIALGVAVIGAAALYCARKARQVHLMTYAIRDDVEHLADTHLMNLWRSLSALQALQYELEMHRPLPETRGWAASPDVLLWLARHAKAEKPAVIVECGSGVSTLVLARCCQMNGSGHVHSLEHESAFGGSTRAMLEDFGVASWATVYDAPLRKHLIGGHNLTWYDTSHLPADLSIDLLFIDGPPEPLGPMIRYPAGALLVPRISAGGIVVVDDMIRDDEQHMVALWMAERSGLVRRDVPSEKGCAVLTVGQGT